MDATRADRLILLTGATGYVGGRLLKALRAAGYPVRCLARRPEFLVNPAALAHPRAKAWLEE